MQNEECGMKNAEEWKSGSFIANESNSVKKRKEWSGRLDANCVCRMLILVFTKVEVHLQLAV